MLRGHSEHIGIELDVRNTWPVVLDQPQLGAARVPPRCARVLMSGYSEQAITPRAGLLAKPFTVEALSRLVVDLLDRQAAVRSTS
ncbi:MAG: hypothetical protein SFX73_28505 [Kofleriaceae bacterium]|nr:hypothetical protein [Kofleriaceae bacterium]